MRDKVASVNAAGDLPICASYKHVRYPTVAHDVFGSKETRMKQNVISARLFAVCRLGL